MNFVDMAFGALCLRAAAKSFHAAWFTFAKEASQPNNESIPHREPITIIAVVKVLNEEHAISGCVDYWRSVLETLPIVELVIVGSEVERVSGLNQTLDAAKVAARDHPRIHILEAPSSTARSAAGQLNYAISAIANEPRWTWLLFNDVDTRYTRQGLEEITNLAKSDVRFIQQSGLFLSNFEQLSYWQKGHALLQSRWTISHELLRLRLYNATGAVLAHVVGHGLCARLDAIRDYGGFPDFGSAEDIELGFYLVCAGEQIIPCCELDSSDNPKTLREGLAQEFSWSYGARDYALYWLRFRKNHRAIYETCKLRSAWMLVQGIVLYANWLVSSWIVAIALVFAAHGYLLALGFIGFYLLDFLLCILTFARLRRVSFAGSLRALPALVVAVLRHSIPADYGLWCTVARIQRIKYKTTHH